jgi:hypothetical protein
MHRNIHRACIIGRERCFLPDSNILKVRELYGAYNKNTKIVVLVASKAARI